MVDTLLMGSRLRKPRRMGLGYNSLIVSEYVAHSSEVLTYGHALARQCADPVRVDTVKCGGAWQLLFLNMTCYSGFPLQTEPWFSPNDRCGSTTTRLRRFRLPPSSRERTLVCFIVSTEGKYKRAGWYLRAHLLGRYPHGGAPASRKGGVRL